VSPQAQSAGNIGTAKTLAFTPPPAAVATTQTFGSAETQAAPHPPVSPASPNPIPAPRPAAGAPPPLPEPIEESEADAFDGTLMMLPGQTTGAPLPASKIQHQLPTVPAFVPQVPAGHGGANEFPGTAPPFDTSHGAGGWPAETSLMQGMSQAGQGMAGTPQPPPAQPHHQPHTPNPFPAAQPQQPQPPQQPQVAPLAMTMALGAQNPGFPGIAQGHAHPLPGAAAQNSQLIQPTPHNPMNAPRSSATR